MEHVGQVLDRVLVKTKARMERRASLHQKMREKWPEVITLRRAYVYMSRRPSRHYLKAG